VWASDIPQSFETCLSAATDLKPGQVIKVERKVEAEIDKYEFDIRGQDGNDWDIECLVSSGKIVEIEQEVGSPNDPLFKAKARINEKEARDIALAEFPGEIVEVEYEIEANGDASYEFDIDTNENTEIKIEINASTGKIIEKNIEIWQVGLE
ncbi:MAG TPA: peptidase, partial [Methylophaga aminisulfidivorans]|nr:peptidase [Methylophaga aminisulfidivorans]